LGVSTALEAWAANEVAEKIGRPNRRSFGGTFLRWDSST
jgi:hypothetical protein